MPVRKGCQSDCVIDRLTAKVLAQPLPPHHCCLLFCRAFNQDQVVMDFLRLPAKSQRGLPARPVVGCAVSIRLDLPPAVIEEWFGN